MLSAGVYSFRQKSRLAVSLSWIGGYTNVLTLMFCGATTSHMTGNVTHFGQAIAEGGSAGAIYFGFLIVCFVLGAASAGVMLEVARWHNLRSRYTLPLAAEATLLMVFSLGVELHLRYAQGAPMTTAALFWMTGAAALAMGLQNATITKISGAVIRTTHLTGVSTDFGLEGAQFLMWLREKMRVRRESRAERVLRISRRHPSVQRLLVLAGIFWSFLFGGVVGALVVRYALWMALMPPVGFLVFIVVHEYLLPIAEVEELDLLGDPELRAFGIERSLLPPELGVYRLCYPTGRFHHNNRSAVPYFLNWVERLPRRWRVIILSIGPQTRFDSNAFLDLKAAVGTLASAKRRLIISGISPAQYRSLHALGVTHVLDIDDFCPDLEFAVARGMELVRQSNHGDEVEIESDIQSM